MIRDALDILNPKGKFTASATYYDEDIIDPSIGGKQFNYEYINPYSNTYRRLFANIQSFDAGNTAIRTNDCLPYKINGIVITQDGQAFRIVSVEKDFQSAPKQVLRLFGTPVAVQYVIRMVKDENPWGIT